MNRLEHLLTCLSEECDEVGQRTSKALRFGLYEVQEGQCQTNAERISGELSDLIAVATILQEIGHIPPFQPSPWNVSAKRAKIEEFMAISRAQGVLQDD